MSFMRIWLDNQKQKIYIQDIFVYSFIEFLA